jgi:hypothetical protein
MNNPVLLLALVVALMLVAILLRLWPSTLSNAERIAFVAELADAADLQVSTAAMLTRYFAEHKRLIRDLGSLDGSPMLMETIVAAITIAVGGTASDEEVRRYVGVIGKRPELKKKLRRVKNLNRGGWSARTA